jgi:hypothetical protein
MTILDAVGNDRRDFHCSVVSLQFWGQSYLWCGTFTAGRFGAGVLLVTV